MRFRRRRISNVAVINNGSTRLNRQRVARITVIDGVTDGDIIIGLQGNRACTRESTGSMVKFPVLPNEKSPAFPLDQSRRSIDGPAGLDRDAIRRCQPFFKLLPNQSR